MSGENTMKQFKEFLVEQNDPKIAYAEKWLEGNPSAVSEFGKMYGKETNFLFTISSGTVKVRTVADDHIKPIVNGTEKDWFKQTGIGLLLDDPSWWNKEKLRSEVQHYLRITAGVLLANTEKKYKVDITDGSSGKGFSGAEGEAFWEWIGLKGIGYTGKIEDIIDVAYKYTGVNKEKIATLRPTLIEPATGIVKYMNALVDESSKFTADQRFVYSNYLWGTELKSYYDWMIAAGKTLEGQKANTADAILVDSDLYKDKFWNSSTEDVAYTFLPVDETEYIINVLKNGKSIGKMIQVSMKKGLDEAQGGGTVDSLKLLTYTDPEDGETYKVYPAKLTATIANKLDEGFVSFIKGIWTKVKKLVSKLWSKASGIAERISKTFMNSAVVSKISKSIIKDLSKGILREDYIIESEELTTIYNKLLENQDKTSKNINDLQNKLLRKIEASGKDSLSLNTSGMSEINLKGVPKELQHRALSMCVLNLVALSIINNMITSWVPNDGDMRKLYNEMLNMVLNTKVGNTVLPVVELYGDTKWHVYDRSSVGVTLNNIEEWASGQETSFEQSKPMVINYGTSLLGDGKGIWNVAHFYYIKDVVMNEENTYFVPYYFKMTLRSSGMQPKMNSSLKSFIIKRNKDGSIASKSGRIQFKDV